jgi:hypothetical protein
MALKSRTSIWHTLHLLARLIGLTGVAAAPAGWFIYSVLGQEELGLIVLFASAGAVGFAILFEVRGIAQGVASQRGLFGFNVIVQIVLALALVVGANVYSFEHYRRFDLTRAQIFTLDDDTRQQLQQMRGETEIVVVQKHVSFGQRAENKQDKYDFAAQRKIVEKVKDLAEQFEDLGPRFHVHLLDIQDDNYDKKLEEIRANVAKELAEAIEKAPENSVIFYSKEKKRLQRISFSDIYQLDKQGSIENKNLVLKYQGVGPFARKIFNIEAKNPRIATAVIHPVLGFQDKSNPRYTMSGGKKVLDAYGFDCIDIALRRLNEDGSIGEPTVLTYDESQYEEIEDDLADLADEIKDVHEAFEELTERHKFWSDSSLADVNKKYAFVLLPDGREAMTLRSNVEKIRKSIGQVKVINVNEDDRGKMIAQTKDAAEQAKEFLDEYREEQTRLVEKKGKLRVENLAEKRRFTDMEAKAKAMLADVDLLIVPRLTAVDIPKGEVYPNRIHRLETGQFNAVKAFLKQGKPVLFLLGPANDPRPMPDFGGGGADGLEPLLGELGFYLPKQTILYNMEMRDFKGRRLDPTAGVTRREIEVPGLRFDETTPTFTWGKAKEKSFSVHPIRASMRMMNRAMTAKDADAAKKEAKEKKDTPQSGDTAEVRVRHPRPVYFMRTTLAPEAAANIFGSLALPGMPGALQAATSWVKNAQKKPDDGGVFLLTREECWNEENPFVEKNKAPRFTPTKDEDAKKGTADEERRGPFPIGVAVETQIPASWLDKDASRAPTVRVAVIGSGGVFIGPTLPPLKEKMFLDTVNWLLGRDDLLARDADTWQYPRVSLSPFEHKCWYLICYGLPCLFIYLGTVVWLLRRMR